MRNCEDFRREFPEADQGFRRAVDDAISGLAEAHVGHGFRVPRLTVVLAAAVLLLSSVAVAATIHRMNIQDFTVRSQRTNLTDEARHVLAADFPDVVIDNLYADIVITEAVYDGMAVYILLEAIPKNEDAFVIPSHLFENNQAFSYGWGYPTDMTIQQYVNQQGYHDIITIQSSSSQTPGQYFDSARNEDGSFSLMMWALVQPEYRNLPELTMNMTISVEKNGRMVDEIEKTLSIPLAGKVETACSRAGEAVTFENAGVYVKKIEIVRTPMTSYIIAEYNIVNKTNYRKYITYRQFRILDKNGQEPPKGAYPLSMRFDESYHRMGNQPFYITNRVFDEMPTEITLGEYEGNREDGWTEGKTYTFHLE